MFELQSDPFPQFTFEEDHEAFFSATLPPNHSREESHDRTAIPVAHSPPPLPSVYRGDAFELSAAPYRSPHPTRPSASDTPVPTIGEAAFRPSFDVFSSTTRGAREEQVDDRTAGTGSSEPYVVQQWRRFLRDQFEEGSPRNVSKKWEGEDEWVSQSADFTPMGARRMQRFLGVTAPVAMSSPSPRTTNAQLQQVQGLSPLGRAQLSSAPVVVERREAVTPEDITGALLHWKREELLDCAVESPYVDSITAANDGKHRGKRKLEKSPLARNRTSFQVCCPCCYQLFDAEEHRVHTLSSSRERSLGL